MSCDWTYSCVHMPCRVLLVAGNCWKWNVRRQLPMLDSWQWHQIQFRPSSACERCSGPLAADKLQRCEMGYGRELAEAVSWKGKMAQELNGMKRQSSWPNAPSSEHPRRRSPRSCVYAMCHRADGPGTCTGAAARTAVSAAPPCGRRPPATALMPAQPSPAAWARDRWAPRWLQRNPRKYYCSIFIWRPVRVGTADGADWG